MFFDDRNVYVSARAVRDFAARSADRERDAPRQRATSSGNDYFGVHARHLLRSPQRLLLHDQRARRTARRARHRRARSINFDYNTIWDVQEPALRPGGWTTEIAIPFKSLRYRSAASRSGASSRPGGLVEERVLLPDAGSPRRTGMQAVVQDFAGATLVGIEAPPPGAEPRNQAVCHRRLEHRPPSASGIRHVLDRDFGFDVKYGLTKRLAADFTYNTDFAQAEVDDQQINLTRFNLFYPEKREFFLEGQGLFTFGGASSALNGSGETPLLFFSRRIGLNNGQTVPIQAGGRAAGQGRALQHRRPQHPHRRRSPSRALVPATTFVGDPRQARHPAAQQHRRHRHRAHALARRRRHQLRRRRRRQPGAVHGTSRR